MGHYICTGIHQEEGEEHTGGKDRSFAFNNASTNDVNSLGEYQVGISSKTCFAFLISITTFFSELQTRVSRSSGDLQEGSPAHWIHVTRVLERAHMHQPNQVLLSSYFLLLLFGNSAKLQNLIPLAERKFPASCVALSEAISHFVPCPNQSSHFLEGYFPSLINLQRFSVHLYPSKRRLMRLCTHFHSSFSWRWGLFQIRAYQSLH